jgi:hypothetical protein
MKATLTASELRIGNWVQAKTDNQKFQIRDGEDIDDLIKWPTYTGIPLTPEMLEKAGFVYERELTYVIKPNTKCHLVIIPAGEVMMVHLTGPFGLVIPKEIKYIHQLQNLFYTTYHEELSINL